MIQLERKKVQELLLKNKFDLTFKIGTEKSILLIKINDNLNSFLWLITICIWIYLKNCTQGQYLTFSRTFTL